MYIYIYYIILVRIICYTTSSGVSFIIHFLTCFTTQQATLQAIYFFILKISNHVYVPLINYRLDRERLHTHTNAHMFNIRYRINLLYSIK